VASLREIELAQAISRLPDMEPLNAGRDLAGSTDDIFLCALGFENRCLHLPRSLAEDDYRAGLALYCTYSTSEQENDVNRKALEDYLGSISDTVEVLAADDSAFVNRLRDRIREVAKRVQDRQPRIVFDCSVAANRLLLKCMKVLIECDAVVRVIYSEASIYHPTRHEYTSKPSAWTGETSLGLERGVSNVAVSPDHSGHHLDPLPDCVVLFPTFKPERSRAVLSFVDPSLVTTPGDNVIWLLGAPHLTEDAWRLDVMREVNGIGTHLPQHVVSTFDYKETLSLLESLHAARARHFKISLSPLGSKMQALGCSLFHYLHPDVRVIFATPEEYNASQYSEGCKATWQLRFGFMPKIRHELDKIGTVEIIW